jgi:hypothetical protein
VTNGLVQNTLNYRELSANRRETLEKKGDKQKKKDLNNQGGDEFNVEMYKRLLEEAEREKPLL